MSPQPIPSTSALESAPLLLGPYNLFSDTFKLEFLAPPPSLDATVLMRATYSLAAAKQGKQHPQSPPLHLHFEQAESFWVAKGRVGTEMGWGGEKGVRGWGREDGVQIIEQWVPHRFWPHPDATDDSVIYVWAHPSATDSPMDHLFFLNLLMYISDVSEGKRKMDLIQIMLAQHATASALVLFPTAQWLGPLRWWVPWILQSAVANVGLSCGYRPLMEEYTPREDWEEYVRVKKA